MKTLQTILSRVLRIALALVFLLAQSCVIAVESVRQQPAPPDSPDLPDSH